MVPISKGVLCMTDTLERAKRINIICEVYGTSLERLRKLKHCIGNDLTALKEIAKFLHLEQHLNKTDIGDILFRHRSTISYYLDEFDSESKPYENKSFPAANGALQTHGIAD